MSLGKRFTLEINQNNSGQHVGQATVYNLAHIGAPPYDGLGLKPTGQHFEIGLNGPGQNKAIKKVTDELRRRGIFASIINDDLPIIDGA